MAIQFDSSAQVYELFTAEGEWVGAFDYIEEARAAALAYVNGRF